MKLTLSIVFIGLIAFLILIYIYQNKPSVITSPTTKIEETVLDLSGTYQMTSPDNSLLGSTLCFYVDDKSKLKIPRSQDDARIPWFCFDNQNVAKQMFKLDVSQIFADKKDSCISGNATIKITNYLVNKAKVGAADSATLTKVNIQDPFKYYCAK